MCRNSRLYLAVAAFLASPLVGCADGPTGVGNGAEVTNETLVIHQVSNASDFRVFTHAGRAGALAAGVERDLDCPARELASMHGPRAAAKRGSGGFVSFEYDQLPPLNPFCGCPKQPWGGAPAGYTCRLTGSRCDETGRSCSYTCSKKPPVKT